MSFEYDSTASTLIKLFARSVHNHSERPALIYQDNEVTYDELSRNVYQLAHWLVDKGIGPETIVPIAFDRSIEMIVAMLAIIVAGGAYLPIDIESPVARINDILTNCRSKILLTMESISSNLAFSSDITIYALDRAETREEITRHSPSMPEPHQLLRPVVEQDAPYVIYTSGSTGKPKGVINNHLGVANSLAWMASELSLTPDDRCVLKAPYTFDLSVWEIFVPLTSGGALVIAEPGGHRNPTYMAELIERQRVTTAYFVPTMLSELLDCEGVGPVSCLRNVVAIGEALTGQLQKRFLNSLPGTVLWNSYGPTEAAVGVTLWRCRREDNDRAPPLGNPAWNTELYILDADLEPAPVGQMGEIFISGVQVATGYLNRDDLTRERFIPCRSGKPGARMYRTGDYGELRDDGHITFLGRQDGQVKFNGVRIELGEIEAAIASLAGIAKTAVIVRSVQGATMLVAYLVMRPGVAPMSGAELCEGLVALLPGHMIPSLAVNVEALPLTTSGKLDVKALPDPVIDDKIPYRAPMPGLESEIASLFGELTGFSPVSADHSFFQLGGTSLMAMRLAVRLKAKTGFALPMRALVECPTPAALAAVLQNTAPAGPLPANGRTTVFMFPGAGGDDLQYGALSVLCAETLDLRTIPYPDWRTLCRTGETFDDIIAQMALIVETAVPEGEDIRLGGYSLGGDVAYGVARRLEATGRRVQFLGVIDTDAPGQNSGQRGGKKLPTFGRTADLWRSNRLAIRVRDKLVDRLPHSILPIISTIVAQTEKNYATEFQMAKRVMVGLRKAWQIKGHGSLPPVKLQAPTVLFQSEALPQLNFQYDGWAERCAQLNIVPVAGTHLTMLNPDYIDGFVAEFVSAVHTSASKPGTVAAA